MRKNMMARDFCASSSPRDHEKETKSFFFCLCDSRFSARYGEVPLTKHIGMDYKCKSCGHPFLPIKTWRMCPKCGKDADTYFDLPEAVYDAGVYHRKTHYGKGSHTPRVWGVFSYGDHLAQWGFRLFDWLMSRMRLGETPDFAKYIERISLPDGREGDYFRAVLESFYDVFVELESPMT